jgi:hypothetical protein
MSAVSVAQEVTMQHVLTFGMPVTAAHNLTPDIQDTLARLAEVELLFEADRECLAGWVGPEAIRQRLTADLEAHHARQREPLVQRLAELYQQHTTAAMVRRLRVH